MSEASPALKGEQGRRAWTAADVMSFLRIPLAAAFVLVSHTGWRLAIVGAAAVTDLLDGPIARRRGSSAYGPVLDPIADKVFMAAAVGVVAFSGLALNINPGGGGTVVIRGITLKALTPGSGQGINLQSGNLFVESSVIDGWATGVAVGAATKVYLTDTTVRNNTTGVDVSVGAQVSVDNARFENNGVGLQASAGQAVLTRAVLSGNTTGTSAGGSAQVTMHKCQVANNGTGVNTSGGTARVSDSTISGNTTGLNNGSGTLESFVNNQIGGNGANTAGSITNVPLT